MLLVDLIEFSIHGQLPVLSSPIFQGKQLDPLLTDIEHISYHRQNTAKRYPETQLKAGLDKNRSYKARRQFSDLNLAIERESSQLDELRLQIIPEFLSQH